MTEPVVVVGGEALIDLVPVDLVPVDPVPAGGGRAGEPGGLPAALAPRLGGSTYNVTVALGRLGVPTGFLSRVSTDGFGIALIDRLREAEVDVRLVQRGPEPTTLAVVGVAADRSATYTFYVGGTADRLVDDPGPLPAGIEAISLGSLSLLLEPGASVYERVLRRESAAGRLVMLDPNIRPTLIPDAEEYRRRYRSWLPDVGLLKLSVDDVLWLAGADADPFEVAGRWAGLGPAAVVLTRGAAGLSVLTPAGLRVDLPSRPVAVVDTIGAGDTVQAGVLAGLHAAGALSRDGVAALDEAGWRRVLGVAAEAAAITCGRPGADPPWAWELPGAARTG